MRRWIIFAVALFVVALFALPALAVYYVAFTQSGLQFVARHVPQKLGNVQLRIGQVSGTLAGGVSVGRVEVEHERVYLRFEGIKTRIDIAPLLLQTIHAPELTMNSAYVEVRRRQRPVPKYEPRFLPRGLKISVDRLQAQNGTLVVPNGRRFETTRIAASGIARHKTIRFFEAGFLMDAFEVSGDGELRAADPMKLSGTTRLSWKSPPQPQWIIGASVNGDLDVLNVKAQFTTPLRADFSGRALDLTRAWHWEGRAQISDFDLRTWGGGGALGRITGELALEGDAQGFKASGPLTPAGLNAGSFHTVFDGSYANRVVTAEQIEVTHFSGSHLTAKGEIAVASGGPRLALAGTWKDFRWPLTGDSVSVRSASGQYSMLGVWPYDLRAFGVLEARGWPEMPFEMTGRLAKTGLVVDDAIVDAFDGQATLAAEVTWSPARRWSARGQAVDIDPAHVRKDLPGRLDFAFDASGDGFNVAEDGFQVQVTGLAGRLRNLTARGSGHVERQGTTWLFEDVRGQLGGTDITLDGRINDQLDLSFALKTQDLSLLNSESRGALQARGSVRGTLKNPTIDAAATGSSIHHAGMAVGSFDARIDFDPARAGKSMIDIHARNVVYGQRTIDRLSFALDGAAADHTLQLTLSASRLKVQSRANGAFANGVWSGHLRTLSVNGSEALHLDLEKPAEMFLSADMVRLGRMCLAGSPARLCTNGDWTAEKWSAAINANDLPISTFTAGLTPGVDYKGVINITAHASGNGKELLDGDLRAELANALISHKLASGRTESITFGSGALTAKAGPAAITGEIALDAERVGMLKGNFNIQRTGVPWKDMPLRGQAQGQTSNLGFASIYFQQIDRAAGTLAVDLVAGGTLGKPLINGVVRLSNAELDFYQINLSLRDVGMEARLLDNGLDFGGFAKIGTGTARARGHIEWRNGRPFGKFDLSGQNLRVVNVPEAKIDASPDLDFRIDGRQIAVSGSVKVPHARIVPADLTNAVRASNDEIILDESAKAPTERFEVLSDVNLSLGDQVSIDTSGLRGRLTGNIAVRSGYEEVTRGSGELNIADGEYTAYGRRLTIERGRLIFTGGPVGNPGVDIRAIKKYQETVAGINVRGTLLQPRLTFFSEPPMPQSQIVSLILAGGSFAGAQTTSNGTDRDRERNAGNELLAQGGAILAQQLGQRVGIEDVSIESDLDNETSLVLGKYLSPRLYVSYGISLTESLNTIKLRYTLSDHWTLRTEFGEEGGADVVYTIDK